MDEEFLALLKSTFVDEAREHLHAISTEVLLIERMSIDHVAADVLNTVFRAAHSLKGAARVVDAKDLEDLANGIETVLTSQREGVHCLTAAVNNLLMRCVDLGELLVERFARGDATPIFPHAVQVALDRAARVALATDDIPLALESIEAVVKQLAPTTNVTPPLANSVSQLPITTAVYASTAPESAPQESLITAAGDAGKRSPRPDSGHNLPTAHDETMRISIARLDALMIEIEELRLARTRSEHVLRMMVGMLQQDPDRKAITTHESATASERSRGILQDLTRQLTRDSEQVSRTVRAIDTSARQLRMLPLETITRGLTRVARDAAMQLEKQVRLEVEGSGIELDRQLLEGIKDPLLHLVWNAIDHGIESPAERQAAGKHPVGRIVLRIDQQGNQIAIHVDDDGRGIDLNLVRTRAAQRGLDVSEGSNEQVLLDLLFRPGFSTREQVGTLSGRGVGMDVVKVNVERLGGRVQLDSIPGQGTRITLIVPATLTTLECLLVNVAAQVVALPALSVQRIVRLPARDVVFVAGRPTVPHAGHRIELASLRGLLELPPTDTAEWLTTVVLHGAAGGLALLVDDVLGQQDVVQKPLGFPIRRLPLITGATVLGNGQLAFLLQPGAVLRAAYARTGTAPIVAARDGFDRTYHILVVDDSITTRTLERSILQSMGFTVSVAKDGQDALDVLATTSIDLVVSDIEMPRLDGLALTERLRANPQYTTLPVVLVTSLDAPEQRARGLEVGANAYIVKRGFDQHYLVQVIKRLLGAPEDHGAGLSSPYRG